MTDQAVDLLKLVLQTIIASGAVIGALLAWRTKKAVQEVHVSLNSRLTQLLEQTAHASRAEGRESMRGAGGNGGGVGPAGPTGAQGPVGPQGIIGPQGKQGD